MKVKEGEECYEHTPHNHYYALPHIPNYFIIGPHPTRPLLMTTFRHVHHHFYIL